MKELVITAADRSEAARCARPCRSTAPVRRCRGFPGASRPPFALILAVPVHAGERRNAKPGNVGAEEQDAMHIHHDGAAVVLDSIEAIGAGEGRAVEQGTDASPVPCLQPELAEAGKFFRPGRRRIDGDAAGGCAILSLLAGGAEIACALEGQPVGGPVPPFHDPETRRSPGSPVPWDLARWAVIEIVGSAQDFPCHAALYRMNDPPDRPNIC